MTLPELRGTLARCRHALPACIVASLCLAHALPLIAAPTLYTQPAYQSPVRGEPDDLLLIAGDGLSRDDVVVYQALSDTTQAPAPPRSLPDVSNAIAGIAPVVSADIPRSLTIKLPIVMRADQSYALWVRSDGQWSRAVQINDARPWWITPSYVFATGSIASLPRYLKVVGRNLQPAPGARTLVRLVGPQTITMQARVEQGSLAHYVAQIDLPPRLQPGQYRVQLSRDGANWTDLEQQSLIVKPDPVPSATHSVAEFGCSPDDGKDDVRCIAAAIRAAASGGGGTVSFPAGVWDVIDTMATEVTPDGILVPVGVNLSGARARTTTVLRHAGWADKNANHAKRSPPVFTLLGRNVVQDLRFKDMRVYRPADIATTGGVLQLGKAFYRTTRDDPRTVADIVIARNTFDRPVRAVDSGGPPIERLFVIENEFGAYATALSLGGNRYNVKQRFRMDDSVIAHNVFRPGSYVDAQIQQGSTASHIGGTRRLDFSDNVADGTATQYLQDPQRDQRGWRAAFFWHMADSHEMMLVARNTATCTGDKAGDGEAISYDSNVNTFAFSSARRVLAASTDTVTVSGPLRDRHDGQSVDLPTYYVGHWVRVVDGPGLGQVRRIDSYAGVGTPQVTFSVSPPWDVVPAQSSRISVAREYWQVYTVDNVIDQRQPPCRKSNLNGPEGGEITLYASFADSAVEGNRQFDTDGITVHHTYNAEDPACPTCKSNAALQSFVEVRGNTIEGEYSWMSDCSQSGILVSHSAAPTPSSPSPVVGYGLSISHNAITHADGVRGGAITVPLTWYKGPAPYNWKLMEGTLIHHNTIRNLTGNVPLVRCDHKQSRRVGINLYEQSLAWGTVLYANTCTDVSVPLVDRGRGTVRVCPPAVANSCECPGPPVPAAPSLDRIGAAH